jgi:uncharacterized protein (TIGR02217 family)
MFVESPVFPDYLGFDTVGGPGYSTEIVTTVSGREQRNIVWARERHRFDLSFTHRTQAERDEINSYFRRMRGRAIGFRFLDPADHTATDELIGTGDSSTTVFQLRKAYSAGVVEYREISKPRFGVVVKVGGSIVSPTVDLASGRVTFAAAPASGAVITWSGTFDVPVRFEQDAIAWRIATRGPGGLLYVPESLSVIEVRP